MVSCYSTLYITVIVCAMNNLPLLIQEEEEEEEEKEEDKNGCCQCYINSFVLNIVVC